MKFFRSKMRALVAALLAGSAGGHGFAQGNQDDIDWATARAEGTIAALERYLADHPLGKYAGDAFYQLTIQSIDPSRSIGGIEPGAGPDSGGGNNSVVGTALDVY